MQALEQLKQLVFNGGFDKESRDSVLQYEQRLQELSVKEKLAANPVIKEYIDYLQTEIDRAETLLKTDRTLTDRQRDALFERIDLASHFISMFNGKERESLEQSIKDLLDVAKN